MVNLPFKRVINMIEPELALNGIEVKKSSHKNVNNLSLYSAYHVVEWTLMLLLRECLKFINHTGGRIQTNVEEVKLAGRN